MIENPAIADWFFFHRIERFVQLFYVDIFGAFDYWYRFEWQHRGSPHIHGMAWLRNAPNVEAIMDDPEMSQREVLIRYVDSLVSTWNPAILPDGSNLHSAPHPRTDPHICSMPYTEVIDHHQDLNDLIATCQRHTRCSASYCLRNVNGQQVCRFGYPHQLQSETIINTENEQHEILTARNDSLINSYNSIQLSGWRANVDMKYITSKQKVIEYCAKYATKSEPRSQPMREIFNSIVKTLRDGNTALTAIQKLLINSIGQRDYSSQETCHLLLQLPMFRASRNFIVLSLDGTRVVEQNIEEAEAATALSIVDHYRRRPSTGTFDRMTLLKFARSYSMPKELSGIPNHRRKDVVVTIRPFCPPDPDGPYYEQYCRQRLMLHVAFRQMSDLLGENNTYAAAYAQMLRSTNLPPSFEEDVHRLDQVGSHENDDTNNEVSFLLSCIDKF